MKYICEYMYEINSMKAFITIVLISLFSQIPLFGQSLRLYPRSNEDGKAGYVDINGKYMVDPKYKTATPFKNGFGIVSYYTGKMDKNTILYSYDREPSAVPQINYSYINASGYPICNSEGLSQVDENHIGIYSFEDYRKGTYYGNFKRFVFFDGEDYRLSEEKYASIWSYRGEGLYLVNTAKYSNQSKLAYANTKGEIVIPGPFKSASTFSYGYATVMDKSGRFFIIDTMGNYVLAIDSKYNEIGVMSKGLYFYACNYGAGPKTYHFFDIRGNEVQKMENVSALQSSKEGVIIFRQNNLYGCANERGDMLIKPYFSLIYIMDENRVLAQRKDNSDIEVLDLKGNTLKKISEDKKFLALDPSSYNYYDIQVIPVLDTESENYHFFDLNDYTLLLTLDKNEVSRGCYHLLDKACMDHKSKVKESDFKAFAGEFVHQKMTDWLKKGEFEKTSEWEVRTSENNKESQRKLFLNEVIPTYIQKQNELLGDRFLLSQYDADNEIYTAIYNSTDKYIIHLAPLKAKELKEKWSNCTFSIVDYKIVNDELYIISIQVESPAGGKLVFTIQ